MKCPICEAPLLFANINSNNEAVWVYNRLAGVTAGNPDVQFRCAAGCEIEVKGKQVCGTP